VFGISVEQRYACTTLASSTCRRCLKTRYNEYGMFELWFVHPLRFSTCLPFSNIFIWFNCNVKRQFLFKNKQHIALYSNWLTWQMYCASLTTSVQNFTDVYLITYHWNVVSAPNMPDCLELVRTKRLHFVWYETSKCRTAFQFDVRNVISAVVSMGFPTRAKKTWKIFLYRSLLNNSYIQHNNFGCTCVGRHTR